MPIRGCTDAPPRFTRAGHIRLGVKTQNARGSIYPEKSDHFIADFESPESIRLFHEIYGPQPKKITIAFAHETAEEIFPQWYMCYGASAGLKCKGDGETAWRADDKGNLSEVECPGPGECDFGRMNRCKQQARMMFFIRGLPGFQVFQCNTTSWNSIRNINSGLEMLRVVRGDRPVRGVWVDLYLVPQKAQHDGKQVNIYVLKLDIPTNLDNLKALECALDIKPAQLPAPDESRDEYLTPTLPEAEVVQPAAPTGPSPEATAAFAIACKFACRDPRTESAAMIQYYGAANWAHLTDADLTAYPATWAVDDAATPAPAPTPLTPVVTATHPDFIRFRTACEFAGVDHGRAMIDLLTEHNKTEVGALPAGALVRRAAKIEADAMPTAENGAA